MNIKIANILIEDKYINFIKNKNLNGIEIIDKLPETITKPTLVVGWDNVSNLYKGNLSILNKTISDNLYWTFSPNEKRMYFDDDTAQFIHLSLLDFFKKSEFLSIDPIILKIKTIEDIFKYLNSNKIDSTYIDDSYLYYYNSDLDKIIGLDINYFEELGFKSNLIKEFFIKNSNKVLIEEYNSNNQLSKFKEYFEEEIPKKYICKLFYLDK